MSIKIKYHKARIEPCGAVMHVFFDIDNLFEYAAKYGLNFIIQTLQEEGDSYGAVVFNVPEMPFYYVVLLPEEYNEHAVWHEALHIATGMWHQAGAELHSCYNDEVLTYTQGHVVSLIQDMYAYREALEYGFADTRP